MMDGKNQILEGGIFLAISISCIFDKPHVQSDVLTFLIMNMPIMGFIFGVMGQIFDNSCGLFLGGRFGTFGRFWPSNERVEQVFPEGDCEWPRAFREVSVPPIRALRSRLRGRRSR